MKRVSPFCQKFRIQKFISWDFELGQIVSKKSKNLCTFGLFGNHLTQFKISGSNLLNFYLLAKRVHPIEWSMFEKQQTKKSNKNSPGGKWWWWIGCSIYFEISLLIMHTFIIFCLTNQLKSLTHTLYTLYC